MDAKPKTATPTIGSLFAGIGGFDAGFKTAWQVEIDPTCRAVLQDRFPYARQHEDVRTCLPELSPVDVIVGGFPCQDVSAMGKRRGLAGERTGLFFDALNIINTLKPRWVALENVPGLLNSNAGQDFQTVIQSLAECRYVGYWRVLDARYFGVPTRRRRVFMVAGLGQHPPIEFMADAGAMDAISGKASPGTPWADAHDTLLAGIGNSAINIGCSDIVAVAGARHQMVERQRATQDNGLLLGLDEANACEARAAGNAVCPQVAHWIAQKLIRTF